MGYLTYDEPRTNIDNLSHRIAQLETENEKLKAHVLDLIHDLDAAARQQEDDLTPTERLGER